MAYRYADILARTKADPPAFLAECDADYQRRIQRAADVLSLIHISCGRRWGQKGSL